MAQYTITFSCGHTGTIRLYGKESDRQRSIRYYEENGLCPECYKKQQEEAEKKRIEEKAKEAADLGLSELTGTEKQIAWANKIRVALINDALTHKAEAEGALRSGRAQNIDRVQRSIACYDAICQVIGSEERASQIIAWRNEDTFNTVSHYHEAYDDLTSGRRSPDDYRFSYGTFFVEVVKYLLRDQVPEVKEVTLSPETKRSETLVKISYTDRAVVLDSPKDRGVIDTAKSCGFRWNGCAWEMKIALMTGSAEDRATEIANKLLVGGYQVTVPVEIKDAVVEGKFEARCTRWITSHRGDLDHVWVNWDRDDETMYYKSGEVTGAKWVRGEGMSVPASSADEIEDFAQMYGFRISPGASTVIEAYRRKVMIVEPAEGEAEHKEDGSAKLDDILESSRDVIEDLKDED